MERTFKIPAFAGLLILAAHEVAYLTTYDTIDLTVSDKNTIYEDGNPYPADGYKPINWQVHTNQETFRVDPDWRRGEFAAAERYHALKPGQSYRVQVAGWSIPSINWHRNIVRIENQ